MDPLFGQHVFSTFGPSYLDPQAKPAELHGVEGKRPLQLRARLRQECPRCPGVYGMVDAHGQLIYVGKAKNLRVRLLSYFRSPSRPPKATRLIQAARAISWEYQPSEFAALLRELELIRRWRPAFNVQGQPRRYPRTFVCLGRQPAPYVFLTRRPPSGVLGYWGPVVACTKLREAVRRLNDWFGLRDCPQAQVMVFADQAELFPEPRTAGCLRYEIGTCLGPCAAFCSRAAYRERVRAARAFLEGTDLSLLQGLAKDLQAAAAALAFERAAALREKLAVLTWLHEHLEHARRARERLNFIYPVAGKNGQDFWYLIRQGFVAAAFPKPQDDTSREQAASVIRKVFDGCQTPTRLEEFDSLLLVAAWFRAHPEELDRTLQPEQAVELVSKPSPPGRRG